MPNTARTTGRTIAKPKIDSGLYGRLLAKALPSVIETEKENERLLAEVDKLMDKDLTPEEARLFDLMVKLIEDFEERRYSFEATTPRDILKHFMEVRHVKPRDLWDIFGSKGTTSMVLSGKRTISKTQARSLAKFFNVPADLFL
jgi:HTH-type transcriptional regulator/antitoxin HigA